MIQALPNAAEVWNDPTDMIREWEDSPQKALHEIMIAGWVGEGGKVVELGCGNGRFSLNLNYTSYTGYDQSLAMLEASRALNPNIQVALADIFRFSSDESYDTLLMIDVAIHQNEPMEALTQIVANWYAKRYFFTLLVGPEREVLLNSTIVGYVELPRLYTLPDCRVNRVYGESLYPEHFSWVLIELIRD